MIHIELSLPTRPTRATFTGRLAAAARRSWKRFSNERRLRATVNRLHRLGDHSLRDIGLERDNIEPVVRARCASW